MSPTILVVTEDASLIAAVKSLLSGRECRVEAANTGLQGLNAARRILPDAIILDEELPDIQGSAVSDILLSLPSTRNIPVVVLYPAPQAGLRKLD